MTNDHAVTLNLTITPALAQQLWVTASPGFLDSQPERFEHIDPEFVPFGPSSENAVMMWCESAADALLLIGYEQARGYQTALLWDLAIADDDTDQGAYVVMSSRSYSEL